MNRLLLLLIVTGCATGAPGSYHQAAMRPAPYQPPPAYTPGFAPGTPREAVYTPAGAGLPGERSQGAVVPTVPRSKGRMLPRTNEPGVWAADPVRASGGDDYGLCGIMMPVPAVSGQAGADWGARCVNSMNDALKKSYQWNRLKALSPYARRCVAAQLYHFCSETLLSGVDALAARGKPMAREKRDALESVMDLAAIYWREACTDTTTPKAGLEIIQIAGGKWVHDLEGVK